MDLIALSHFFRLLLIKDKKCYILWTNFNLWGVDVFGLPTFGGMWGNKLTSLFHYRYHINFIQFISLL